MASTRECPRWVVRMRIVFWSAGLSLLVNAGMVRVAYAQRSSARTEIIRGRVSTDSGAAIPGAAVIATRAPDFSVFQTTTDTGGRYILIIPNGTADYLLHISAIGRQPFRKRVTIDSTMARADTVFTVDARLAILVRRLAPVRVQASKPKPSRVPDRGTEPGAAEVIPDQFLGLVSVDLAGNVAALAATVPGVMPVGGGYSVLGLGADQNQTTMNGLAFAGANVPRDAAVRTRISTTSFDPARGGFSGAQVSIDAQPGSVYSGLYGHVTMDAPALQYTDAVSAHLGQRFTSLNASVGGSGPLTYSDRFVYSYGAQAGRRMASIASLLDADPVVLQHEGVAPDSVTQFLGLLNRAQIPITGISSPSALVTDQASVLARFDRTPFDPRTFAPLKATGSVTVAANWLRTDPVALTPSATPGHAGERWQGNAQVQGLFSTYLRNDYLSETRTAVSISRQRAVPLLKVPDASVLVASRLANGVGGLTQLQFGGNGDVGISSSDWTWETISELQLYPAQRSAHRVKLTAEMRLDGFHSDVTANRLGTFRFNSLADLAAARPTSFSRVLFDPTRTGGEWTSYLAASDLWRVGPTFQLLYGARLEGNMFTDAPAYNPLVDQTFGARTDVAPANLHISPRLGFTWTRRGAANNGAIAIKQFGQFNSGPTGYVRGGIGEFRNTPPAGLLSNAIAETGLPGSTRTLTCLGPAAPTPAWDTYVRDVGSIPSVCSGAASATNFADASPIVTLFDRHFEPPRSWRGNLSYTSLYRRLAFSVDGTYSLNLSQPSVVDLNLRDSPVFTLPREERPVFVPATQIVPTSGAVSPLDARLDGTFGRVINRRSDLRSISRQITISLWPDLFMRSNWYTRLDYTISGVRSQERGFDGSTFQSPSLVDWGRASLDARHQLLLRAGYGTSKAAFTVFSRVQSGLPFTPMVNTDVNGDGIANDRAFVFDPATLTAKSDSALAVDMRALLSGSARVRTCLVNQLGRAAGRNSCEGPWTAAMNAQLTLFGGALHLPRQIQSVAINVSNPLGGLDQLWHGSSRLHGWGTQPSPDPVLYEVRGFETATNSFSYQVNPRFGNTNPNATTLRAPFRLTIDVAVDLGRDIFLQQLERSLKPGRAGYPGERFTIADLKQRYAINIPDPYIAIVADPDSLLLSAAQTEAIQRANVRWREQRDSLLTSLAGYLAGLGDTYDIREALRRQEEIIAQGWEKARVDVQDVLPRVLSPVQLRVVPGVAATLLRLKPGERPGGRTLMP
jgi:hypothetical protein